MIIIEKNEGQKVQYEQDGTTISFANGELALNCAIYQRDWPVHLDICANADNNLVIGTAAGLNYVAQLDILAREYVYPEPSGDDPDGETGDEQPAPIPLDMDTVTLTLWALV